MTHTAVVLVNCKPNQAISTKKSLDKLPNVSAASAVRGAYDIVVKITSSSVNELKEIIAMQIRKLSTVRSTLTLRVLQQ